MAKKTTQSRKKLFNLDLDSLLSSELSQEEHNDGKSFTSEPRNQPKKFKSNDSKISNGGKIEDSVEATADLLFKNDIDDLNEIDDTTDVTKFFENVGNDLSKSMQTRKTRLGQFTEAVISIYQTKITDMIKKQDTEMENFKQQAAKNIEEEMNKFEDEFKKLKQQESKLIKILEQQLKMLQKSSSVQELWIENFAKLHQNFLQGYKNLRSKHNNEAMNLKQILNDEIANLQNKFVMDAKKEEMQTMKKYLSSIYF